MNASITSSVLALALASPTFAGSLVESSAPTSEANAFDQSIIGAPYIRFGRTQDSETDLPGYAVGSIGYSHTFGADFDSLPGDIESDVFSLYVPVLPLNFDEFHLIALGMYSATSYDTSVPNLITEDTLHSFQLPVLFIHDISTRWIWGGMVMPSFSGNKSTQQNWKISTALGLGYAVHEDFLFFAGGYYSYGFNDHFAMPGISFIWRPDPLWEVFLLGPFGGVTYKFNDRATLSLFGEYDSSTWHVRADNTTPIARDMEYSSLQVGLKAEYQVAKVLWASVSGGYSFFRNMEIETQSNSTLLDEDIDPAPFIEASLNIRF